MKKIIVDVMDNGEVHLETHGFKGPVCLEQSQFLKDLLGKEIAQQLVPAFYQKDKQLITKHIPLCG